MAGKTELILLMTTLALPPGHPDITPRYEQEKRHVERMVAQCSVVTFTEKQKRLNDRNCRRTEQVLNRFINKYSSSSKNRKPTFR